jgi:hypothetical protein
VDAQPASNPAAIEPQHGVSLTVLVAFIVGLICFHFFDRLLMIHAPPGSNSPHEAEFSSPFRTEVSGFSGEISNSNETGVNRKIFRLHQLNR